MPIYVGNQRIGAIYKGSIPIARVYKGSTLVWEKATGGGGAFPPAQARARPPALFAPLSACRPAARRRS